MERAELESLEIGKMVRIDTQGLPYQVVGLSEGGDVIFLLRSSFIGRPNREHALQIPVGDINAVLP